MKNNNVFTKNNTPYLATVAVAGLLITLVPSFGRGEMPSNQTPYPEELYAMCFDGIDNDGDGFTDQNDPDCPRCFDGIDNDGDGLIDEADPDCPGVDRDGLASLGQSIVERDSESGFSSGSGFGDASGNANFNSQGGFGSDSGSNSNSSFDGSASVAGSGGFFTDGDSGSDQNTDRRNSDVPVLNGADNTYRTSGVYTNRGYRSYR